GEIKEAISAGKTGKRGGGEPARVSPSLFLSLCRFFGRSFVCGLSDKAVAAPMSRLNKLRRLRIVIERDANFSDADLQHAIRHGCLWPDGFDQFIFRHQASRIADEVEQKGKLFGRNGDGLPIAPQTFVNEIEAEGSKDDLLF